MKQSNRFDHDPGALPPVRIKLRTRLLGSAINPGPQHSEKPEGDPFVIRLKDEVTQAAEDASLATQFAV